MVTHIALFSFHDAGDVEPARAMLNDLRGRLPQIRSLVVGVDAGRSGSPWQVALTTTHDDWDAYDGYRSAPAHVEVLEWLTPRVSSRASVDFES